MLQFNLRGVTVMLVMPSHYGDIPVDTFLSIHETQTLLREHGVLLDVQIIHGGSIVEVARTKAAHNFLQSDRNRCFWVDSDMQWKAKDFMRLVALSTVMPVVGATYVQKNDLSQFGINAPSEPVEANQYGCLPLSGFGLGFTIVIREVMEKLAENAPKLIFPESPMEPIAHVFRCDSVEADWATKLGADGVFRGEDMAFFADVKALGYEVHLDPTINLGHIGQKVYTANFADQLKKLRIKEDGIAK